ncbi:MAG: hypothetical protein R3Y12_02430 [Clostridia bacterium]
MGLIMVPILLLGPLLYVYLIKQQIIYSRKHRKGAYFLPICSLVMPIDYFFIFLLVDRDVYHIFQALNVVLFFSLPYFSILIFYKINKRIEDREREILQYLRKLRIAKVDRLLIPTIEEILSENIDDKLNEMLEAEDFEIKKSTEKERIEQMEDELLANIAKLQLECIEENNKKTLTVDDNILENMIIKKQS